MKHILQTSKKLTKSLKFAGILAIAIFSLQSSANAAEVRAGVNVLGLRVGANLGVDLSPVLSSNCGNNYQNHSCRRRSSCSRQTTSYVVRRVVYTQPRTYTRASSGCQSSSCGIRRRCSCPGQRQPVVHVRQAYCQTCRIVTYCQHNYYRLY